MVAGSLGILVCLDGAAIATEDSEPVMEDDMFPIFAVNLWGKRTHRTEL